MSAEAKKRFLSRDFEKGSPVIALRIPCCLPAARFSTGVIVSSVVIMSGIARGAGAPAVVPSHAPDESPSAVVHSVIDAYNRHDLAAFLSLHAGSMVTVAPGIPRPVLGLDALRETLPEEWASFPDARIEIKRLVDESSVVAVEAVWSGTYRRSLPGLPPAKEQPVRLAQMGMYTVRDGRVTSLRSYYDPAELEKQLGSRIAAVSARPPVAARSRTRVWAPRRPRVSRWGRSRWIVHRARLPMSVVRPGIVRPGVVHPGPSRSTAHLQPAPRIAPSAPARRVAAVRTVAPWRARRSWAPGSVPGRYRNWRRPGITRTRWTRPKGRRRTVPIRRIYPLPAATQPGPLPGR